MPAGLLVSVRTAEEARAALRGGADLIDVKEPSRGALGAADSGIVDEIHSTVAGRVPISVARGEWTDGDTRPVPEGVTYVKWGLAGVSVRSFGTTVVRIRQSQTGACPVLVAYADHKRASCPDPESLAQAAADLSFSAFLIDTSTKDGSTLLDWMDVDRLFRIRAQLGEAGVRVALAGSLDREVIQRLSPLAPDWFAVRGAACVGGRMGPVCADRVRTLRMVIAGDRDADGAG